MASPPPYPMPASVSRSRTSPDEIRSLADAMLRSSIRLAPSSTSSTATTLPVYPVGTDPNTRTRTRSEKTPKAGKYDMPSSVTTSRTRDRLLQAEKERDELRRAVEGEKAMVARLKREAGELSATEKDKRLSQLKLDVSAEKSKTAVRSAGLFKESCSTDLLFLIDTTGSMQGHINAAKEQVKSIVSEIKSTFLNEAEVRIAVVGYKDHGDTPNIQFLDFTSSADQVRSFIDTLEAIGGNDFPEDVLGGINKALNLSWRQQTRCIIHIADAPPHGANMHDQSASSDNYHTPGSEPHRLTYEPLVKQMVGLKINYALLRINSYTDRMALKFLEQYVDGGAECVLHKSNKHFHQAAEYQNGFLTKRRSSRTAIAGLMFEELELGVQFSVLRRLVVKMVTTSASRTAVRLSTAPTRPRRGFTHGIGSRLGGISEDGDGSGGLVALEEIPPRWDERGWLNETLKVEGFSPDVVVHNARTLDSMMAHDDNINMSVTELTIHKRSLPFAQGAMRLAFYARTAASTNRFVVKSFKKGDKRKSLPHLAEDMRCQALCKAFALEFNAFLGDTHPIDFAVTACLKGKPGASSEEECLSLEPYIQGNYVKYNNNCGYVNDKIPDDKFNQAAQAFSHFTFERSRGRFLVSDLQGVGHLLTDPAVHTLDPERFKLTDTNLGDEGFKFFFATHSCNIICRRLGLKSNAAMIASSSYAFRDTWPSIDNTVCCSNKFCGRIVPLASARKSDEFRGHHWCDTCWPQLSSSKTKCICIAPGPSHEFDVSMFYYESQGQRALRTCPKHYSETGWLVANSKALTPGTAVVDGNFWNKLKFATSRASVAGSSNPSRPILRNPLSE